MVVCGSYHALDGERIRSSDSRDRGGASLQDLQDESGHWVGRPRKSADRSGVDWLAAYVKARLK